MIPTPIPGRRNSTHKSDTHPAPPIPQRPLDIGPAIESTEAPTWTAGRRVPLRTRGVRTGRPEHLRAGGIMPATESQPYAPTQPDSAHRIAALNRNDKAFHVVLAQQFDRPAVDQLCQLADMIRSIGGSRQGSQFLQTLLNHRRAML